MTNLSADVYFYYPLAVRDRATGVSYSPISTGLPGNYVWTVKTQACLSAIGFPCRLVKQLPDEGIIVTHREFLPNALVPNGSTTSRCAAPGRRDKSPARRRAFLSMRPLQYASFTAADLGARSVDFVRKELARLP